MGDMHISDLSAFIIQLAAIAAVFAGIVGYFGRYIKKIARLERVVFDENDKERYITRFKFEDMDSKITKKLDAIMSAVNLINDVQMVELDVQIQTCEQGDLRMRLIQEKEKLNNKRGIL